MKVGIATITSTKGSNPSFNYGNVLQNYALTKYIERKYSASVETIYYSSIVPEYTLTMRKNIRNERDIIQFFDDALRVVKRKIKKNVLAEKKRTRDLKFKAFLDQNIKYSGISYSYSDSFTDIGAQYDCVITGSDQVWNPFYEGSNPFFYLGFMPKGKRISYAPSIGVSYIPREFEKELGEYVRQLDYISIREIQGKELLKDKYEIDAQLVCDPVFLLSAHEWSTVARVPNYAQNKKYFVVYILGKKTYQTKMRIKALEKSYGLKAIDVYSKDETSSSFCGPEEFVGLIANAQFIVTDSFHGAAFSVIFERPIIIVDRNASSKSSSYKMNSRIDNLLSLIHANNRMIDAVLNDPATLTMGYDNKQDLENLIAQSALYLDNAISDVREIIND